MGPIGAQSSRTSSPVTVDRIVQGVRSDTGRSYQRYRHHARVRRADGLGVDDELWLRMVEWCEAQWGSPFGMFAEDRWSLDRDGMLVTLNENQIVAFKLRWQGVVA